MVEERTHETMVLFQAHCRGYLTRKHFKQLLIQDSAAYVIQSNVLAWMEITDWPWWKLYCKVSRWKLRGEGTRKKALLDVSLMRYSSSLDQAITACLENGDGEQGETGT